MATKNTLYSWEELIEEVKRYARERGGSLSKLTTEFFATLARKSKEGEEALLTDRLQGALKGAKVEERMYRRHLEEKYL